MKDEPSLERKFPGALILCRRTQSFRMLGTRFPKNPGKYWPLMLVILECMQEKAGVKYNFIGCRLLMKKRSLLSHIIGYHEHRQVHLAASPPKFPEKQITLQS